MDLFPRVVLENFFISFKQWRAIAMKSSLYFTAFIFLGIKKCLVVIGTFNFIGALIS
jgi:hypothetical protein